MPLIRYIGSNLPSLSLQNFFASTIVMTVLLASPQVFAEASDDADARAIVRAALDHWRGSSSFSEMTMTIERSDWTRSLSMRAWTRGDKLSLVRVTDPARDAGNGTLLRGNEMWTFSPKVNRIIKVPSAMMNQSWMGSDLSNKDISRSSDIVDQYQHRLLSEETIDDHRVYQIESIPLEEAAVVWGREVLRIRDDYVMLEHQFWDQDNLLVKTLLTLEIDTMDGRAVAARQRMSKTESPEEWTEIQVQRIRYDVVLEEYLFTRSNLRNPRETVIP
ncbi:outer membrane lipoprotein-sorting protein [Aestuariirhabdus sp. Z084]|uniref:outer membrane lipoprotein-sorting protein n=1 Tax=Aestuariirhabdus haliotis TaxID=2918751 RepID=UPI00201B440E|nr:outer membrane lipoprotein-sorting protein [Aestuariirhabdus haliotis]MCL6414043.1 outer membrane lipoprotein-sorting protein [Aestuariirhabdus haliotis]